MATEPQVKPTGSVTHDEYTLDKPYTIIGEMPADEESPSGWVLGWKNPSLRNGSMGWRLWEPLEWGMECVGENGEKLKAYVPDTPMRMRGPDRQDNYVRRGDLILCRIPSEIWHKRQARAVAESKQQIEQLHLEDGAPILPGVTAIGEGRTTDRNPTFGKNTEADRLLAAKLKATK